MDITEILNFYKDNYQMKIFYKKCINIKHEYGYMYIYAYKDEIKKFKDTFGDYFPFYIMNQDILSSYLNVDKSKLESRLKKASIYSWNSASIFPQRDTRKAGVYGELFLDFYLRVIKGLFPIISYVSKRSYRSRNESTGIDSVVFDYNGEIEFYICETKFVSTKSNARTALIGDVKGTADFVSHFSQEYLNDYFEFVMKKSLDSNIVKIRSVNDFIMKVNLENITGKTFLDVAIKENAKLHAVLFAIYQDDNKDVNKLDTIYLELGNELDNKLCSLGIEYTYEIIFIPTNNTSMLIKEGIDSYYE
jgi:hypothetical protein